MYDLKPESRHWRICKWTHILVLLLQDDDAVNAEAFINKASFLVSNSQHEVLNLQYKVSVWHCNLGDLNCHCSSLFF